nr:reverse transcriptase domain-containing protein [Tanacetum cinerariifolium]
MTLPSPYTETALTPTSPDYIPASHDYLPASDTESDPSEDSSSDHILPLPAILPFLSSTDDSSESDTSDTPPSPTHGTPFTEMTLFTQSTPVASSALCFRVMILTPVQPIPHGRPYHYHPNGPVHMMTVRKRVRPLPNHRLVVRHSVDYSSSDHFTLNDSLRYSSSISSSETSSDSSLDQLPDSSSDHSLQTPSSGIDPEMGVRGPVKVRVDKVTHLVIADDIPEPAHEEGAVEVTYETLGDLIQRVHDHTEEISVHRVQAIESIERDQGHIISEHEEVNKSGGNRNGGNGNRGNGNGGNGTGGANGNGNDLTAYTRRFQELVLLCTRMVPNAEDKVERFVGGIPDNIQGNVIAVEPTKLQDAFRIANNLMDQKLKAYARNTENKRRLENNPRDNHG